MIYEPPFLPENRAEAMNLLSNAMLRKDFATVLPFEDGVDVFLDVNRRHEKKLLKDRCENAARRLLKLL